MELRDFPFALRERLGSGAATALGDVLASEREAIVTTVSADFERRLIDECGKLRVEIHGQLAELRGELIGAMGELRGEVRGEVGAVRGEMNALRAEVRGDIRAAVADVRAGLVKWSFLFWVTQLAALIGVLSFLR